MLLVIPGADMIQLINCQTDKTNSYLEVSTPWNMQMMTVILPLCLRLSVPVPSLPPSGQLAFLLENVPCNTGSCRSVGRMFRIHWDQSDLGAIQNAVMATFFDIYEDVSGLCGQHAAPSLPPPFSLPFLHMLAISAFPLKAHRPSSLTLSFSSYLSKDHTDLHSQWYQRVRRATTGTPLGE